MYQLMLSTVRLERAMADRDDRPQRSSGHEACLASLATSLRSGDLVSEDAGCIGLGHLRRPAPVPSRAAAPACQFVNLPSMAVDTERLLMAVGAAVAAKAGKRRQVLLATIAAGAFQMGMWQQMLSFISRLELPMLLVVLPGPRTAGQGRLSARCPLWGVPGFSVDGSDALALYRVIQESLGRLRGGGGPVLIECVSWKPSGQRAAEPLARMRHLLLARGILTQAQLDRETNR